MVGETIEWQTDDPDGEMPSTHPAKPFGRHAVKLFEEVVEHTTLRRRKTKSSETMVDAGLLYDRYVGVDEYGFDLFEFSARLEAWDQYCRYLDLVEPDNTPEVKP